MSVISGRGFIVFGVGEIIFWKRKKKFTRNRKKIEKNRQISILVSSGGEEKSNKNRWPESSRQRQKVKAKRWFQVDSQKYKRVFLSYFSNSQILLNRLYGWSSPGLHQKHSNFWPKTSARRKTFAPLPIVFFIWKSRNDEIRRSRGRVLRSSRESLEKL